MQYVLNDLMECILQLQDELDEEEEDILNGSYSQYYIASRLKDFAEMRELNLSAIELAEKLSRPSKVS